MEDLTTYSRTDAVSTAIATSTAEVHVLTFNVSPSYITHIGAVSASGGNLTSGAFTLPPRWKVGDVAVFWWYTNIYNKTFSKPAALTEKRTANSSGYGRIWIGYKVLAAGDIQWAWTASSKTGAGVVYGTSVFRFVDTSGDPFEVDAAPATFLNTEDPDPASITTVTDGAVVCTVFGKNKTFTTCAAMTDYTLSASKTYTLYASGALAYRTITTAGAENPGAWDLAGGLATDDGYTWSGALKPASLVGGVFVDETIDANNNTANDFPLIASANTSDPTGDCTYFGCMGQFSFLQINVGTAGTDYVEADIVWEYWNGSAWADLGETDNTHGFTTHTGSNTVMWTVPVDWATCEVNTLIMYWVRSRVAGGTTDFSDLDKYDVQPLGTQVWRGGKFFVTPSRVRFAGFGSADSGNMNKARAVGGATAFTDYFTVTMDGLTGETSSCIVPLWTCANGTTTLAAQDTASASWLIIMAYESSAVDVDRFYVWECNAGTLVLSTDYINFTLNKRYYVKANYTGGANPDLVVTFYYDREMTKTVTTALGNSAITHTLAAQRTYSHWGPVWGYGHATLTGTGSGVVGEFSLDPGSNPLDDLLGESGISFPVHWTDEDTCEDFADGSGGWTWAKDAGATLENVHWPLGGSTTHCAKVTASGDDDGVGYHATTADVLVKSICQMTVCLGDATTGDTALAATKERQFGGLRDTATSAIWSACAVRGAGTDIYWRMRFLGGTATDLSAQTTYTLLAATEYTVLMGIGVGGSGVASDLIAVMWVKSPTDANYTDWTLVESYVIDGDWQLAFNAAERFVGCRAYASLTGTGGACYVKDFKYKDGGTYFPKLCRGGASDGTLLYVDNIRNWHTTDYGYAYDDIMASTDNGLTWKYLASIGPTANTSYDFVWPIYDGTNWWFFTRYVYDGNPQYVSKVYTISDNDLQTDIADPTPALLQAVFDAAATATFNDTRIFPSRMIETSGSDQVVLCGAMFLNTDGAGYPDEDTAYGYFAHFNLTDYSLTNIGQIGFSGDILADLMLDEPFIYRRPSDGYLACIMRRELTPTITYRDEYLHVSSNDGAAWSTAIWPGEDWSDISASLKAFVFRDFLWIVARDGQAWPWHSLVWKCDPDTLNVISERVWTDMPGHNVVVECGNGDVDASYYQSGSLKLDCAFDLVICQFRRVSTGLVAGPQNIYERSGILWTSLEEIAGVGGQGITELSGVS